MGAHGAAARQLPGTRGEAERLGRERAHRAQVDDIARQLRIHRLLDEGHDLRMLAAERLADFHVAGDFLGEAHAARAVDAARHVGGDERPHVLVGHHALLFLVARGRRTVAHRQVLQLAFAALVANGAVQGMVDQQELHHPLLGLHRGFRMGPHLHAVGHRRGTGGQRLGRLLHLHQAHAAVGGDGQLLVIAEMGNEGADLVGGIHDGATVGHLDLLAVDFDF